jgi:uncharacterized protein YgbK (DUF1537 family)
MTGRMPRNTQHSALAAHLPDIWLQRGLLNVENRNPLPAVKGASAVIVGSVSSQTRVQLDMLQETTRS